MWGGREEGSEMELRAQEKSFVLEKLATEGAKGWSRCSKVDADNHLKNKDQKVGGRGQK